MRKRREISILSLSFLDVISGALGAVIILYVAIPKNVGKKKEFSAPVVSERVDVSALEEKIKRLEEEKFNLLASKLDNEQKPSAPVDVGFKFKGRHIVFAIDTSGSMMDQDRIGQVKAGLKMLVTAMPESYAIDIVQFPYGEEDPFRAMWGVTKNLNSKNKIETNQFIRSLIPLGSTPTRDVMGFILTHYNEMTDLVILTDGLPTHFNSREKDNEDELLKSIREINARNIQISAIGVGANLESQEYYRFLLKLTQEHKGFFVGF